MAQNLWFTWGVIDISYWILALSFVVAEFIFFLAIRKGSDVPTKDRVYYFCSPVLSALTVIVFYRVMNHGGISDLFEAIGVIATSVVLMTTSVLETRKVASQRELEAAGNHYFRKSFVYAAGIYMLLWLAWMIKS